MNTVIVERSPIRLFELLVRVGLAKSNSEAKRLVRQKAVKVWYPKGRSLLNGEMLEVFDA
jgi:predicted rRNA methylase YqxC with S4 and FtsJ domains